MKMKRSLFSFSLAGLLIALCSFLYGSGDPAPAQASLLWKIEGKGIKSPSYLFGTMHLIGKDYFYFPESLEKLVKKSDILVMEIGDLTDKSEMMKYIMLPEGTFFDFFTPEQTDSILVWAKSKMGLSEEAFRASFSSFKPFVVVQAATQMQFLGKTESYEMTLQNIALAEKIRVEGLETVADQIKIFDGLTREQQARMVMESIRKEDESVRMMNSMQQVYRRQRIDSLYRMIHEEGGVLAEEQNAFLDQRNRNWIPKIRQYVSSGKAFIAVGAGHLGGENGIIRLLEKEGYKVTPVKI